MLNDSPDDAFLRFALAMEYDKLGQYSESLGAFLTLRETHPDYVGLYVVQCDLNRYAQMQFADVEEAIKILPRKTVSELKKTQFRFSLPEREQNERSSQNEKDYVLASVIKERGWFSHSVRFRRDTVSGTTNNANDALNKLAEAFDKVSFGFTPQPGTAVIVDNHRLVHGRTPFIASHNDDDRCVLRVYANNSL